MMFARKSEKSHQRVGVLIAGLAGNNGSSLWALHQMTNIQDFNSKLYGSFLSMGDVSCLSSETPVAWNFLLAQNEFIQFQEIVAIEGWDCHEHTTLEESMHGNAIINLEDVDELHTSGNPSVKHQMRLEAIPRGVVYPEYLGITVPESTLGSPDKDWIRLSSDIDAFAAKHDLDFVIVIYSGCTERNENKDDLRMPPSKVYALAAAQCITKSAFINAAAQETLTPLILEVFDTNKRIALGNDLCTGQTRLKNALLGTFVPQGMYMDTVVNFNTLGNKDGLNLHQQRQNASKIASKSSACNRLKQFAPSLYGDDEQKIDQLVQIAYVPSIGDNKRAMDEYRMRAPFGKTLDMFITSICPDTALAMGVLIDLILMCNILSQTCVITEDGDTREITCDEANALCACLLKNPMSTKSRLYFHEARDVLTGFLLEVCGEQPETLRHKSIFQKNTKKEENATDEEEENDEDIADTTLHMCAEFTRTADLSEC